MLKKFIHVGLGFAFASGFSPVSALAEDIPKRGPIPFAAYDKDGSGLISEEEFTAAREERLAARAAEGRPMRGAAGAAAFTNFDTNGDGQLSPNELAAGQQAQMDKRRGKGMGQGRGTGKGMARNIPAFSAYDLDGDGVILEGEFNDARGERISERAEQGYPMKNLGNAPSFSDIDTDGNGQISAEEFTAHQTQRRQERAQ